MTGPQSRVVVVDYGLGNLFSIAQACTVAGLTPILSADPAELLAADAVILPGVGAFGAAMHKLRELDLVEPLRDAATSGRPLLGVCLGMQLLMTRSNEFGEHEGLGVIDGSVYRFPLPPQPEPGRKVPHVGWSRIRPASNGEDRWRQSLLRNVAPYSFMYFVHSYFAVPACVDLIAAEGSYGGTTFCASVARGRVFGCQFHPERSGEAGLAVYRELARQLALEKRGVVA